MENELLKCTSCSKSTQGGTTRFKCPDCGKVEIIRCVHCKKIAIKYECGSCGFSGPN